ncbi:hypothetical protein B0H19DRAFT_1374065 [Mycena capillaripes]|nr:hypothetical protein B0H19DRAFT_1374065 [Mycena capillaripes]
MQMQLTGVVTIVTLMMVVSARPAVVNLSSAELVGRDPQSSCGGPHDGLNERCILRRDNGVTELKHGSQNTGTYDGPIKRCSVEDHGCPGLD